MELLQPPELEHGASLLSAANRLELICKIAPRGLRTVDVGCDHGHVSKTLSAVASEREPHRLPRRTDVPRVVANGLRGHKNVQLAILTGMGPQLILGILKAGPPPGEAIVHSPQHSHVLRMGLKQLGWRIHRQGLAPENGRFAEVMHIRPGKSPHDGYFLGFGADLLGHPWAAQHAQHLRENWTRLAADAPPHTQAHQKAKAWIQWLDKQFPTNRPMGQAC